MQHVTIATDHAGRFIGARDIATGRFAPDATLRHARREMKRARLDVGRVTRRPAVPNDYVSIGRAISTEGGHLMTKGDARARSAVTAVKPSANNGQWTARIMRRNRGIDRSVRVTPGTFGSALLA